MARAEPPASGADQLAQLAARVGVRAQPTDYVLLVDVSASMMAPGRWGGVRRALSALASGLDEADRVTLVTFADGVVGSWTAKSPAPKDLLAHLPATPSGTQTDIGAAIEAGVQALSGTAASVVGAIVLLTDGELDAAPTSRYPSASSAGWAQLRARADQLGASRQIGAFAVSVGEHTDAGLLTAVFPEASVASPADIVGYLGGLSRELTKVRVGSRVRAELIEPLTLTVERVVPGAGMVTARVRLTSQTSTVPLTITGLGTSLGAGPLVAISPRAVTLQPGAVAVVSATITGLPAGVGKLALTAVPSSPWASGLTAAGLTLPGVRSAPVALAPRRSSAPPASAAPTPAPVADVGANSGLLTVIGRGAAGLVAAVLVVLAIRRARRPRLAGSIAVEADNSIADRFVLTGASLTARRAGLRVRVTGRKDDAVDIRATGAGVRVHGVLADGEGLVVGEGRVLRYTSGRSRMLDMVTK